MAACETEGDWRDRKVEDVSVPEDQTRHGQGYMQAPGVITTTTDDISTLHEMPVLQTNSGTPVEYTTQGVYTDGGCAHLHSGVSPPDICLGPNGIRDKRLRDEILVGTPALADASSLPVDPR